MKKVIRLTEADLTRIVKRVLKEQTSSDYIKNVVAGNVGGAASDMVGMLSTIINGSGYASQKVKSIINKCSGSNFPITAQTNKIADSIYNAVSGLGTNENMVYSAMRTPRSVDEFCGVVKSYKSSYGEDLYTALDGDFDSESEWVEIMKPLRDVVLKSQQSAKAKNTQPPQAAGAKPGPPRPVTGAKPGPPRPVTGAKPAPPRPVTGTKPGPPRPVQ